MSGGERVPRVSIGLPVYNGDAFLDETIVSILDQDFTDFELIVSDNDSTDDTGEIARKYAELDPRVRYLPSDTNVGANRNFNRAFRHSRGELFKWAAHDDALAPDYLGRCVEVLDAHPDVVLCHTRARLIDRHGDPLLMLAHASVDGDGHVEGVPDPRVFYEHTASDDPAVRLRGVLRHLTYAFPVFGVVRRSAMLRTKLLRGFYGSDKVILAELALAGRFAVVDEPLWYRRCHPGTSTRFSSWRSQHEWSTPTGGGGGSWYPLDMTRAYADAIRSADLAAAERLRCRRELATKVLSPGKWRQLLVPGPANFLGWGG